MATQKEIDAYIKAHAVDAKAVQNVYGLPASVVLAAGALESSWNTSDLSSLFNNFFGIKPDQGFGTTYLSTTEYRNGKYVAEMSNFAKFDNAKDSFLGYGKFLQDNDRYKPVFAAGLDSSKAADALQAAGYATDPAYAQKLKDIIKANDLTKYDTMDGTSLIVLKPTGQYGVYNGDQSVLESTFGNYQTDTSRQQAYERAAATDPAAGIPTLPNIIPSLSGIGQGVAKGVIILLLIVVILIFVLQVFPLSPANIAAKVAKGVVAS